MKNPSSKKNGEIPEKPIGMEETVVDSRIKLVGEKERKTAYSL